MSSGSPLRRIKRFVGDMKRTAIDLLVREKKANKAIDTFLGKNVSETERKAIRKELYRVKKTFGFQYHEYFLFHFDTLTDAQKQDYVSDKERFLVCDRLNPPENYLVFQDKYLTYQKFGQYYHRQVLKFEQKRGELELFSAFWQNHDAFIVKPFNFAFGRGIQIIHKSKEPSPEQVYKQLCTTYKDAFVIEELVVQNAQIAAFHPQSVNTLRVTTFKVKDTIEIFFVFLRIGQGDAVVDNAGAGGIACPVNLETGEIFAAMDERGNHYERHPDTGVQLIGTKIPQFEKACALAKELALVVPTNCYTAWDLAFTDDGWVMIEGNYRGQFTAWQAATHTGFRKKVDKMLKDAGL